MREAVIVESVRSPGGRYKRGGLSQTRADEYAVQVIKGLMATFSAVIPMET